MFLQEGFSTILHFETINPIMHGGYIPSISTMIYHKLYHDCGHSESWKHATRMAFHDLYFLLKLRGNRSPRVLSAMMGQTINNDDNR